jgi:TrmH family RNA methyltransferase
VPRILAKNDRYQLIEAVKRSRLKRRQLGVCFVEGVRALEAADRSGRPFQALIHALDARLSGWARDLVDRHPEAVVTELHPRLMSEISDREQTSEILALARIPPATLDRIPCTPSLTAIVLDRPSSPGNLGSILRSANALGGTAVVVRGHAADLWDPLAIRSSQGAVFSVPAATDCSNRQVETWITGLRNGLPGLQVVAATPSAATPPEALDFRRPTVLVLGNERRGLSAWLREIADASIGIPTRGTVDSLNLAAAAAILLYEIARQRGSRSAQSRPGSLPG